MRNRDHFRMMACLIAGLLAVIACGPLNLGGDDATSATDEPTRELPTVTPEPRPTETPTAEPPDQDMLTSQAGGFKIPLPEGWYSQEAEGSIVLSNREITQFATLETMPLDTVIVALTSLPLPMPEGMSLEQFAAQVLATMTGASDVGEPQPTTLDGSEAMIVDMVMTDVFTEGGGPVNSAAVLCNRADGAGILLALVIAPAEGWADLREQGLDTLQHVSFFTPSTTDGLDSPEGPSGTPDGFAWQVQREIGAEGFGRLRGMASMWGMLYVTDMDQGLWVMTVEDGEVVENVPLAPLGITAVDLAFGSDAMTLYIADPAAGAIAVLDSSTHEAAEVIGAGQFDEGWPQSVAVVAGAGDAIFATNSRQGVPAQVLKFATDGTLLAGTTLDDMVGVTAPGSLAVSPDQTLWFVSQVGEIVHLDQELSVLDSGIRLAQNENITVNDVTVGLDMSLVLATTGGLLKVDPDGSVMATYGVPSAAMPYYRGGFANPQGVTAFLDGSFIYTDYTEGGNAIVSAFFWP